MSAKTQTITQILQDVLLGKRVRGEYVDGMTLNLNHSIKGGIETTITNVFYDKSARKNEVIQIWAITDAGDALCARIGLDTSILMIEPDVSTQLPTNGVVSGSNIRTKLSWFGDYTLGAPLNAELIQSISVSMYVNFPCRLNPFDFIELKKVVDGKIGSVPQGILVSFTDADDGPPVLIDTTSFDLFQHGQVYTVGSVMWRVDEQGVFLDCRLTLHATN